MMSNWIEQLPSYIQKRIEAEVIRCQIQSLEDQIVEKIIEGCNLDGYDWLCDPLLNIQRRVQEKIEGV